MKLFATVLSLAALPAAMAGCETAYAQDGSPQDGSANPQCFLNHGTSRWGWILDDISPSGQSFEVYAGAGQCDTTKGVLVGSVSVSMSGTDCTATFTAFGDATIEAMHFYCSSTQIPPSGLTANGNFPCNDSFGPKTSHSCTVPDVTGGPIYAIVHFEACSGIVVEGDPHFKTWNGKWFDYMGQCDLKMLEAKNFDGRQDLTINLRSTVQYDYSYVEAAAIQIGDDVLEVASYNDYAVNGVDTPYLGGKAGRIGGYDVYRTQVSPKKATYDIVMGPGENITLASYKQLVSVSINIPEAEKYFGNSEGIIGSYSGDLLARDHKTVMEDMDAFGQEWQVTDKEAMLFRTARAPQYPEKCVLPGAKATQRRLGETIAEEAARKACSHKTGAAFDNCVYDVMAIGDLDLAEAGAY